MILPAQVRRSFLGKKGSLSKLGHAGTEGTLTYMKDLTPNHPAGSSKTLSKAGIEAAERRSAQRQQFIAEAQIVEVSSGTSLLARTSDLVLHGCYVDSLNTFAVGTLVRARLKKGETIVEVNGNVVYQMPGLGMGIAFHELSPDNRSALEQWVAHIPTERHGPDASDVQADPGQLAISLQPGGHFLELIRILVKKGVLTESEAAGLLKVSPDE